MPVTGLSAAIARIHRAVVPADEPCQSDEQLLSSFVAGRDPRAFALLVRRHGPMVLSVCRRITGHTHDAEDAFQAVFLTLAQRADSLTQPHAVGNWLYGVAVRTARHARADSAKRHTREAPTDPLPETGRSDPEPFDDRGVFDEELARLPERYRALIVSCDLEGEPQAELARRFGLPVGTVYSRLATARALLAERLRKRGLAPAVLVAAGVAASAPGLATEVARIAITSECLSPRVTKLCEAVMRTTGWKWKLVPVALVAVATGLLAAGLLAADLRVPPTDSVRIRAAAPPVDPADPPKSPAQAPAAQPPAPKPAGPGRLLLWKETKHILLTPEGKEDGSLDAHPDDRVILHAPVLSPDGKRVAFLANENPPTDSDGNHRRHVYFRDVDGKTPGVKIELTAFTVAWDTDGKALIVTEALPFKEIEKSGTPVWLVDVATKKKTKLDLPKYAIVSAVMPDGKSLVVSLGDFEAKKVHLALVSRDGKDVTKLCELHTEDPKPRPSPDGKKILFRDLDPDEKLEKDMPRLPRLYVCDVATKKRERLAEVPLNALPMGYCWSPDGKRIAYTWKQVQPGVPLAMNTDNMNDPKINTETESHLVICDANGKNPKTLMSVKAPTAPTITLGEVDWR
jgi:RNA polymerase sigma factor (sigma-70 family)